MVVHAVKTSGEVTDKKSSVAQNVPKPSFDVVTELKVLKTDVASLKTLNAEIAHIRESLQQPAFASPQFAIPSQRASDREIVQCQAHCQPNQTEQSISTPEYASTIDCTDSSFHSKKVLQLSTAKNRGPLHALLSMWQ